MSRILLLGEYSSFHTNLRDGLRKNGCDVTLASMGDGWKNIGGADIELCKERKVPGFKGIFDNIKSSYDNLHLWKNYDIVQFINPMIFYPLVNIDLIRRILNSNKNALISLTSVGYDYALLKAYKEGRFEYYIEDFEKITPYSAKFPRLIFYRLSDKYLLSRCNVIIPGAYEYSVGYKGNKLVSSIIPMPINIDNIEYHENNINNKIVFFHGLNREKAKGTHFIREALNVIQSKYPSDVEIIIDGHLPYKEYLKLLERTNVVIDQCSCYGYGINALIAMAMGKVVIAGARKEVLEAYGIDVCPIIHAEPNVEQLINQFKYIIENRDMINVLGRQSRDYVEKYHDSRKIAKKYLEIWKERDKRKCK